MFVIVEGPNGAGKTTAIKSLGEESGYTALSSPSATPLSQMLRPACRGTDPWEDIDKTVQFLLFSAARMDEYLRIVKDADEVVVADRWWTSTYVYQCVLQGIPVDFLEYTKHPDERVDLVILLDGDNDTLINRVSSERDKNPTHGKCTWTKDNEVMFRLMDIYRNELPMYLKGCGISVEFIDTTNLNQDEVLEKTKEIIESYKI